MPDVSLLLVVVFFTLLLVFSLTVFYGVVLDHNPRVLEMRRAFAWRVVRWPWPYRTAIQGMLPFALGALVGLLGRELSGRTATLDNFPSDAGQDLLFLGTGLVLVGFVLMLRAPQWILPAWYKDVLARRAVGLEPAMPPPRGGANPSVTKRQWIVLFAVGVVLLVATPVLSWPSGVAVGAAAGLAILSTYQVRRR